MSAFLSPSPSEGQVDTIQNSGVDTLIRDSLSSAIVDTTLALGENLSDRVVYSSFDSLWVDVRNNEIHLYLNAAVKYEDISLEAHHIIINSVNNTIRAEGLPDSLGKMAGTPVYKEGDQMYKASEMTYNFKTKKAWIKDAVTEAQGGFLIGDEVKMVDKNTIYTKGNIYTTCDRTDHPHFGIRITKGKYIPDEKIVAGPSYLEIGDVPIPIGLPFAYYPLNQQKRHGLIFPEFGESPAQGFFLRGLGYYFPLGQKAALELRSDIYSLGSYRLNSRLAYNKRYKFSGSFSADFSSTQTGNPEDTGIPANRQVFFRWNHAQSPKARPNSRFSASVNAGSNGFWRDNSFATNTFTQNSFNSSISYDKSFAGTPFSMNLAMRHSQNTQSKVIDFTAPDVALNMRRITPFKRKVRVGSTKWYEKIGLSYSMQARNNYSSPDSSFFDEAWTDKLSSGILHNIPLSTSLKLFKYVQVSPNVVYNERWYFRRIDRRFDLATNSIVLDSVNGFYTARDYTAGISLNTRIFGTALFTGDGLIKGIRHTVNPSASFSIRPDFSSENYGYYTEVATDSSASQFQKYFRYQGNHSAAGISPSGKFGNINFGVDNNLELKVRSKAAKDSLTSEKKLKVFDSFRFNGNYNLAADSLNFSQIAISARTSFRNFNIRLSSSADPYVYNAEGRRLSQFRIKEEGKLLNLTNASFTLTGSLKKQNGNRTAESGTAEELRFINENPQLYIDFDVPFNLQFNYNMQYRKDFTGTAERELSQNVTFSGDLSLTKNWKIVLNSGYDISEKELTPTQISVYRDLHCWDLSFNLVPFGSRRSYFFTIKPKASILQALKLTQRRDWYDLQ